MSLFVAADACRLSALRNDPVQLLASLSDWRNLCPPRKGRGPYSELYLDSEVFGCFRLHGVQRLSDQNNCSLDLLTEVGTQGERAVIVQFLVTSPPHRITHSFYLYLSSKFQSFPFDGVRNHELCLSNLAR